MKNMIKYALAIGTFILATVGLSQSEGSPLATRSYVDSMKPTIKNEVLYTLNNSINDLVESKVSATLPGLIPSPLYVTNYSYDIKTVTNKLEYYTTTNIFNNIYTHEIISNYYSVITADVVNVGITTNITYDVDASTNIIVNITTNILDTHHNNYVTNVNVSVTNYVNLPSGSYETFTAKDASVENLTVSGMWTVTGLLNFFDMNLDNNLSVGNNASIYNALSIGGSHRLRNTSISNGYITTTQNITAKGIVTDSIDTTQGGLDVYGGLNVSGGDIIVEGASQVNLNNAIVLGKIFQADNLVAKNNLTTLSKLNAPTVSIHTVTHYSGNLTKSIDVETPVNVKKSMTVGEDLFVNNSLHADTLSANEFIGPLSISSLNADIADISNLKSDIATITSIKSSGLQTGALKVTNDTEFNNDVTIKGGITIEGEDKNGNAIIVHGNLKLYNTVDPNYGNIYGNGMILRDGDTHIIDSNVDIANSQITISSLENSLTNTNGQEIIISGAKTTIYGGDIELRGRPNPSTHEYHGGIVKAETLKSGNVETMNLDASGYIRSATMRTSNLVSSDIIASNDLEVVNTIKSQAIQIPNKNSYVPYVNINENGITLSDNKNIEMYGGTVYAKSIETQRNNTSIIGGDLKVYGTSFEMDDDDASMSIGKTNVIITAKPNDGSDTMVKVSGDIECKNIKASSYDVSNFNTYDVNAYNNIYVGFSDPNDIQKSPVKITTRYSSISDDDSLAHNDRIGEIESTHIIARKIMSSKEVHVSSNLVLNGGAEFKGTRLERSSNLKPIWAYIGNNKNPTPFFMNIEPSTNGIHEVKFYDLTKWEIKQTGNENYIAPNLFGVYPSATMLQ